METFHGISFKNRVTRPAEQSILFKEIRLALDKDTAASLLISLCVDNSIRAERSHCID